MEQGETRLHAGLGERLERAPGGGDGLVHVGGRAERDGRDRLLGGRVDDREIVGLHRVHPLPVDVELATTLHGTPPSTVSTILPKCAFDCMSRCASEACSSGRTLSTTG